jgi:hypothetical protein
VPVGVRRLLEPSELWSQEQQLCAEATEGGLLDLRYRRLGEDDPVGGRVWGPQRYQGDRVSAGGVIGPSRRDGSERGAYLLMFLSQSARRLFLPVERVGIDRVVAEVYGVHDMQMGIHAAGQVGGDPKRFLPCGIVAVSEHQGGHGPIGRGLGDSNPADA